MAERLAGGNRHPSDDDARPAAGRPARRAACSACSAPRGACRPSGSSTSSRCGSARGPDRGRWPPRSWSWPPQACCGRQRQRQGGRSAALSLPNKAQFFALGIASAGLARGDTVRRYAFVLLATLAVCAVEGRADKLLPPLAWTLCLAAQLRPDVALLRPLARVLRSRPLLWLGALSYCIYLANEPGAQTAGAASGGGRGRERRGVHRALAARGRGAAGSVTLGWAAPVDRDARASLGPPLCARSSPRRGGRSRSVSPARNGRWLPVLNKS